jgi:hypothetical protein
MPSHHVLAFVSLAVLTGTAVAGCEADPGTVGPGARYTSSSSSAGGAGGAGGIGGMGGTPCECGPGLECCDQTCVNVLTDIFNCGACGTVCPGPLPFCDNGMCGQWPCAPDFGCEDGTCCGEMECCDSGQLCCNTNIGGTVAPHCATPQNGTCPQN